MTMLRLGNFDCDVILGPEALGVPLAVALSLELNIPYAIARKRSYGLPGEIRVDQSTGYSKGAMFVNDLKAGDRVVIVDDVVSTGGTLKALIMALRTAEVEIVDVLVAVEKGNAAERLGQELGIKVRAMVRVEVRDGRLVVLN
jgi:adenine phosphoribosyltransferase